MGGGSKIQTIGYRYSLGAHLALCHGPVDAIREILVDDRTAWASSSSASASLGAGAGAAANYGTVGTMTGYPAGAGVSNALIQFSGTLAGVRLGQSYTLELLTDGVSVPVTLQAISYDGTGDLTTWEVTPATLEFGTQPVAVSTVGSGSNGGVGSTATRIHIDKPELFGGEKREGGLVGDIDVLMGAPDQIQNDYLAAQAGGDVPAYRGLCSLVLRQIYMGQNPYLKPWAVRLTRILKAVDGNLQWYPEKASIVPQARISNAAIYIAMDTSGSMTGSRMAAQIAAVSRLLGEIAQNAAIMVDVVPNDFRIITYNSAISGSIERRDVDPAAYADLVDWVDALPIFTHNSTDYGIAVSEAAAFFDGAGSKQRILIFVTDGAPSPAETLQVAISTLAGISNVDIYAFNIATSDTSYTTQLDNTPVDGVPIVPAGDPDALVASLRATFGHGPDMNPAHIIRECLTDPSWGLGYSDNDIGQSFGGAADALFTEGFGLSLLWQREATIEDFIVDILHHIDATLYVDRRSGRWELRLIREDYDIATLPLFDERNVIDWGELGRREAADLVNSITVKFSDARTDQTSTVSVTDTALVQLMGQVISTTVDYPGIRFESLAVRIAERDLRALSTPLLTGEITVNRSGAGGTRSANLEPGDVIALTSERKGLDQLVVRIIEVSHGGSGAGSGAGAGSTGVRLKIAEDVFALGSTAIIGGEVGEPAALIVPPRALTRRMVFEAPYWQLVQELGHTQADALLAEDPDAGAILASGERPSADALSAQVWANAGTGYAQEEAVEFVPTALLEADVSDDPQDRVLLVGSWSGLADVTIGTLAAIGDEFIRIDGVSATSLTVGRGCLDTIPLPHTAGTPLICWQHLANASEAGFVAGDIVDVKILPETGFGTLSLAQAPVNQLAMASRSIRPLPPGNLQAGGMSVVNPNLLNQGPLLLTWAHRDRLLQTSSVFDDYSAPDIGPEPGVTYVIEIRWVDPATELTLAGLASSIDAGTANSFTLTKDHIPLLDAPSGTKHLEVCIQAQRTQGSQIYFARMARTFRLFMPDGIKIAEASIWVQWGSDTRLTISAAEYYVALGASQRMTVESSALYAGFGAGSRLTFATTAIFTEAGSDARLTFPATSLYIEVLP